VFALLAQPLVCAKPGSQLCERPSRDIVGDGSAPRPGRHDTRGADHLSTGQGGSQSAADPTRQADRGLDQSACTGAEVPDMNAAPGSFDIAATVRAAASRRYRQIQPPPTLCSMPYGFGFHCVPLRHAIQAPHAAGAVFNQPGSAQAIIRSGSPLPAWPTKGGAM
jgi:hypothetical protein